MVYAPITLQDHEMTLSSWMLEYQKYGPDPRHFVAMCLLKGRQLIKTPVCRLSKLIIFRISTLMVCYLVPATTWEAPSPGGKYDRESPTNTMTEESM